MCTCTGVQPGTEFFLQRRATLKKSFCSKSYIQVCILEPFVLCMLVICYGVICDEASIGSVLLGEVLTTYLASVNTLGYEDEDVNVIRDLFQAILTRKAQ